MMKGRDLILSFSISSCIKENIFLNHRCRWKERVTSWCPLFDRSSPLAASSALLGTNFNLSFTEWMCPGASGAAFKSTFPAWDSQRSSKAKSRTRPWTCGRAQAGLSYEMSLSSSRRLAFKSPKHFLTFTHSFDICSNPLWQLGPESLSQFYWWVKWGLKRWNKWLEMKAHMYVCWLKSTHEILGTAWEAQSRVSVLVSLSYWTCCIYLYVNCWALSPQAVFIWWLQLLFGLCASFSMRISAAHWQNSFMLGNLLS